jgi:hypothetical protein
LSTNGTIDNDKKIKPLVEPIEICALEGMEYLSRGSYLLFVSAKARMTEPKDVTSQISWPIRSGYARIGQRVARDAAYCASL